MGFNERVLSPAFPPRSIRTILLSFFGTCIFFSFYTLSHIPSDGYRRYYDRFATYFEQGVYNNTLYQNGTEAAVHPHYNFSQPCQGFPSMDDIMVVMKTGATEAFEKMPTQLLTSLQCIPDFLLFSDLEQQIGKYHIYNVLDNVQDILTSDREEFRLYQAQQDCPVSQQECTRGMPGGWNLDKYKFMNMIVRTWEMRPNMEWYVFVEADTYMVWPNLVNWLNTQMNATEDVYVGGVAYLSNLPFAHGGTGYVISGVLLERLVEYVVESPDVFDRMASNICCGDALLAKVLDNIEVSVQKASPMFNNEKLNTLPFSPRDWCQPLFSLHHMNSEEVSSVWQYEQTRTKTDPLQLRDIYHAFVAPNLVSRRPKWNNLAEQTCFATAKDGETVIEKQAHESPEACARVCVAEGLEVDEEAYTKLETDEDRDWYLEQRFHRQSKNNDKPPERKCFQWRYKDNKCCISDNIRLGYPVRAKDEGDATSGWFVEGIQQWVDAHGGCSDGTEWVKAECVGRWCPEAIAAREKEEERQRQLREKQAQALELKKAQAQTATGEDGEELRRDGL